MFHGSDWQGTTLYKDYEEQFRKIGVELVFLPHTEGISLAQLAEKLRKEENGK